MKISTSIFLAALSVAVVSADPISTKPSCSVTTILDDTPINPVASYHFPSVPGFAAPGKIDKDILEYVKKLPLKWKIGQMTQLEIGQLLDCNGDFNKTAAEFWIKNYGVGSFLDSPGNQGGKYNTYSAERWVELVDGIQEIALKYGPKIPIIYGLDSVHGANYVNGAVLFPQGVGAAATFNPQNAYNAGKVSAKDTRAAGIPWIFAPVLDLNTEKLWGRNYENYGEDPYLSGQMGAAAVRGIQGNYKKDRRRAAACMKHFIGHSKPNSGKDRGTGWIQPHYLLEYFARPFQAAVDAGVASTMESFSDISGEPTVSSKFYLQTVLKDILGFEGLVVTDWGEIPRLWQDHYTAENNSVAVQQAIGNTPIDINMVPDDSGFSDDLTALVNAGKISVERINESAARILQLKKDVGLFTQPYADKSLMKTVGSLADRELAFGAGRESVTLLQNDGALPLKKSDKILVTGPTANSIKYLSGGWSLRWQGPSDTVAGLIGDDSWYQGRGITIVEGIAQVTGKTPKYLQGVDIFGNYTNFDEVIAAAKKVDKVVVALGEYTYAEFFGDLDDSDLALPDGQLDLVRAIKTQTNAEIILVLAEGRPRTLGDAVDNSNAILNAYLPGPWGGLPIAEILYGKVNPSGRQPFTYPKYTHGSKVAYWQSINNAEASGPLGQYDPQWPFGAGFGYSDIVYSNLKIKDTVKAGHNVTVSVKLTNNGPYAANEPVLLYSNQHVRHYLSPDTARLRAFQRVQLAVGQTKTVTFNFDTTELQYYGLDLKQHLDTGLYNLTINKFSATELTQQIALV